MVESGKRRLLKQLGAASLAGYGVEDLGLAIGACGALLDYAGKTQGQALAHVTAVSAERAGEYVRLDGATRRNLELTETMAMFDAEKARNVFSDLKELGVRLSIDDFGTGYSSLNYLRRFPVDTLKIDRSFISNMDIDDNRKIVATMVMLAHSLGLRVIAEGMETEDQLRQLKELGCEFAQGYLFSKPLRAEEAEQFMIAGKLANAAGTQ